MSKTQNNTTTALASINAGLIGYLLGRKSSPSVEYIFPEAPATGGDDPITDPTPDPQQADLISLLIAGTKITGLSTVGGFDLGTTEEDFSGYTPEQLETIASYLANRLELMDSLFEGRLTVPSLAIDNVSPTQSIATVFTPLSNELHYPPEFDFDSADLDYGSNLSDVGYSGLINDVALPRMYASYPWGDQLQDIFSYGDADKTLSITSPYYAGMPSGASDEIYVSARRAGITWGETQFKITLDQAGLDTVGDIPLLTKGREMTAGGYRLSADDKDDFWNMMFATGGFQNYSYRGASTVDGALEIATYGENPGTYSTKSTYLPALFSHPSYQVMLRAIDEGLPSVEDDLTAEEIDLAVALISGIQDLPDANSFYNSFMESTYVPGRTITVRIKHLTSDSTYHYFAKEAASYDPAYWSDFLDNWMVSMPSFDRDAKTLEGSSVPTLEELFDSNNGDVPFHGYEARLNYAYDIFDVVLSYDDIILPDLGPLAQRLY